MCLSAASVQRFVYAARWEIPPVYKDDKSLVVRRGKPNLNS
jgi:hypothetical protein